jgi:hypothetical protein
VQRFFSGELRSVQALAAAYHLDLPLAERLVKRGTLVWGLVGPVGTGYILRAEKTGLAFFSEPRTAREFALERTITMAAAWKWVYARERAGELHRAGEAPGRSGVKGAPPRLYCSDPELARRSSLYWAVVRWAAASGEVVHREPPRAEAQGGDKKEGPLENEVVTAEKG